MNRIFLIALCAFTLSACVRNNPKPIYLNISAWTLQANPDPQANDAGYLSHNFSDVWVYIDNNLIGVFEVPCKIPVLVSGTNHVTLYPTIRNNGIAASKKQYPFVTSYNVTLETTPGGTYDIHPTTQYNTDTDFYIEDFENNPISIEYVSGDALLETEQDPAIAISGRYGHIHLDQSHTSWYGKTPNTLLPGGGAAVYLEIDYRNTENLLTGTTIYTAGSSTDNDNIRLNAQSASELRWKKIYIELDEVISNSTTAIGFEQYLRTTISTTTGETDVYLDNIKIVY